MNPSLPGTVISTFLALFSLVFKKPKSMYNLVLKASHYLIFIPFLGKENRALTRETVKDT